MRLAAILRRAKLSFVQTLLPYIRLKRPPYNNAGLSKAVTMTKSHKYYAVRGGHGGFNGVVNSWPECQSYVNGARGVRYKKFNTLAEAEGFANGRTAQNNSNSNVNSNNLLGVQKSGSASKKNNNNNKSPAAVGKAKLENSLIVYTDGACSSNGQSGARAGYGVYFGADDRNNVAERLAGRATNQRAEMTAVLVAMRVAYERKLVSAQKGLTIFTDSYYTLNGVTVWVAGWKQKGWKTSDGKPVKNQDIWVKIDEWKSKYESCKIPFELVWVKGHAKIPGNEAADRLAVAGAAKPFPSAESGQ